METLPVVTVLLASLPRLSPYPELTKAVTIRQSLLLVKIRRASEKKCHSHRGHGLPGLFKSGKFFGVVETIHSAFSG
jgi:hypothetical protein